MITCWLHQRTKSLLWRLKIPTPAHSCRTSFGLPRYTDKLRGREENIQNTVFFHFITLLKQNRNNWWVLFGCLRQVSYLWEEIPWLQQCLSPSQSSCSCTLQTRLKMLQAVSHLQVLQHSADLTSVFQTMCNGNCGSCGNYDLMIS